MHIRRWQLLVFKSDKYQVESPTNKLKKNETFLNLGRIIEAYLL